MNIRFAQRDDIRSIVGLCKEHANYEKTRFEENNKLDMLSKFLFDFDFGFKCLVVESQEEIVGYATFIKQFSTWDADFYVYLDCLFLKEKARGNGMGKKIMERVKAYAKSVNCTVIQWQTPSFNEKAIGFYTK